MSDLPAYLGISALIIMTPGPDTALTVRNTLYVGRRGGVLTALGVAIGQAIWTVATSAGLTAMLLAVRPAFTLIQVFGATYLAYLGARAVWDALHGPVSGGDSVARPAHPSERGMTGLRQGVLSDLGNPKMAVFFTSLLPQFAPYSHPGFFSLLTLGAIFCSLTFLWLSAYALVVARVGTILQRPSIRRTLDAVTGTILIGLGVRLVTERF